MPGEDAKRTSVTARNCASPRRCQRLGTGWLKGRDRHPPPPTPMLYHPAWVLYGSNKGSFLSTGQEGVGENPETSCESALVARTASKPSAGSLCVQARTPGDATVPASPEECWTYCQRRIPVWIFASWQVWWTGRCDKLSLYGAVFSFVTCLVCVCVRGGLYWRERTSRGHGCGQSMEEDLGSKLLSKFRATSASWRVNLKSPEIIVPSLEEEHVRRS